MSDRRRFPRIEMAADVDVETSNNNFFAGRTRDISIGGLFIESREALEIGSTVGLKVRFEGHSFHLMCRVAWSLTERDGVPCGYGFEFVRLPVHAKRSIEAYMMRRAPELFLDEPPKPNRLAPPSRIPRPRKPPPPLPAQDG